MEEEEIMEESIDEPSEVEIEENEDDTSKPDAEEENDEAEEQEENDEKGVSNETATDTVDLDKEDSTEVLIETNEMVEEDFKIENVGQLTSEEKAEQEKQKIIEQMDKIADDEKVSSEEEEKEGEEEGEGQQEEIIEEKIDDSQYMVSEKASVFTRGRGSIVYEMGPRIRDVEDNTIVTGDFLLKEEDVSLKFYKYIDGADEEEAQEESIVEEEEIFIDRSPYYEKNIQITAGLTVEKLKNNILQKKLAKFFRRRKMEHVLKETDQQFDTHEKYGKKLDMYGELTDLDFIQRSTMTTELENLKTERDSKFIELNKLFEDLQNQEKDTGYGLIHSKTGKPIPDKLVERLVQRQKHQMQTVGDMRLKHIQLKNMVAEKQNAISALDKIGDNLYLMDYEQLKVENRSYIDKMEEKDEELSRLRNKCQKTIQILAHMREKSAALESDIGDLTEELKNLQKNSMAVRGNLNKVKQQRDYYRNMTNKLRDESGLLTQSDLLRDMEVSIEEVKTLTKELEELKEENKIKAQQIRNIRKNIEFPPEGLIKKTQVDSDKLTRHRHLYKGRPSLQKPTLPADAFKHLRNFRGKLAKKQK